MDESQLYGEFPKLRKTRTVIYQFYAILMNFKQALHTKPTNSQAKKPNQTVVFVMVWEAWKCTISCLVLIEGKERLDRYFLIDLQK